LAKNTSDMSETHTLEESLEERCTVEIKDLLPSCMVLLMEDCRRRRRIGKVVWLTWGEMMMP
jgi:hypothetical protein